VFGPAPRDYYFKLNKKLKQLARRSALSYKMKQNSILVLEDFNFDQPKTKEFVNICKNLNLSDKKSVFVMGEPNNNIYLSSRNLPKQKVVSASSINTYEIMNAGTLVLVESSIDVLNKMFKIA
jgi:large subunit ribosomal protein L4